MKVDLDFNVDSLRITDLGEDDQGDYSSANSQTSGSNVLDQIQRNNQTVNTEEPNKGASVGKIRAEADSTALRSFLGQLGNE